MHNSISDLMDELYKIKDVSVSFCASTVRGTKPEINGYIQKNAEEQFSLWKAFHKNFGYLAGFETVHDAFRAIQLVDELRGKL